MNFFNQFWLKYCPQKIQHLLKKVQDFFKLKVPRFFQEQLAKAKSAPKDLLKIDFKGVFRSALNEGFKAFHETRKKSPLKALWAVLTAPFVFIYRWSKSLQPIHAAVLVSFTVASFLSLFLIGKSTYQIIYHDWIMRGPASVDESYSRPDYYKQDARTTSFSSIKLPAIVQKVNGLRSVLVDVSFQCSNRETKTIVDKHEFAIRDHIILRVEPVLPSFALTDEGKMMLKEKIEVELNNYLKAIDAPGGVDEVHIIHILAH